MSLKSHIDNPNMRKHVSSNNSFTVAPFLVIENKAVKFITDRKVKIKKSVAILRSSAPVGQNHFLT